MPSAGGSPGRDEARFFQALLRSYIDSADDAIFVLCDEMKFLLGNRRLEEWLGRPESELTRHNQRRPITDFLGAGIDTFQARFRDTLVSGLPSRVDCRLEGPETEPRWLEIALNRVSVEAGAMVIGVARDVSDRKLLESALAALAAWEGGSGERCCQEAVRHLAETFRSPYAFLSVRHGPGQLRTLAVWADGRLADNFTYDLDGSPCNEVLTRMAVNRVYTGAAARYPQDPLLAELGIESYVVAPLRRSDGQASGLVGVMDRRPMAPAGWHQAYMEIFARRISLELERHSASEGLRRSEAELQGILDNLQDTYFQIDREGLITYVSPSVTEGLGYTPQEVIGRPSTEFYSHPGRRAALYAALDDHGGRITNFELQLRHRDGRLRWVSINAQYRRGPGGEILGVEGTARDIEAVKLAEAERARLASALEQTAELVTITDRHGNVEYVNPSFERVTGFRREEILGRKPNVLRSGEHDTAFYKTLWETILAGRPFDAVFTNRRKDGSLYYEEKVITPLVDGTGRITHFVSTGRDITERIENQRRLDRLAYYDSLTGLANRTLMRDRLEHAIAQAARGQSRLALLFLDLDRFKDVNDSLGHGVGDGLLRNVAARIAGAVRKGDTVARLGGDEFTVVLEDVNGERDVARVAEKILAALAEPLQVEGHPLHASASIGVALYPGDATDVQGLLRAADIAMYRAKGAGGNGYRFYHPEMSAKVLEYRTLDTQLRAALARDEFTLHYQPLVDLQRDRPIGAEALLRWQNPEFGLVPPGRFIPVLEDNGLIHEVGRWTLETVLAQQRAWREALGQTVRVCINISARQFGHPGFLATVRAALEGWSPADGVIEFEITENVLMEHRAGTHATLTALKDLGLRLAIDDFGTGYSSLGYLKRFPLDTLKIDRSFVQGIEGDPQAAAIVQAILSMARALNLLVIAEGIETEAQLQALRAYGCHLGQGFYFGRARSAATLTKEWLGGS